MRKFFVVGLPRSRTYWMSVFLRCSHEAYGYDNDYSKFMASKSLGDSTTCYPWIKDHITDQPIIVIERDINDSFKSSVKLFPNVKIESLEYIKSELDSIKNCLRIDYNEVDDNLEKIWNYCHESPFDRERADKLKGKKLENYFLIEEAKEQLEKYYAANAS